MYYVFDLINIIEANKRMAEEIYVDGTFSRK